MGGFNQALALVFHHFGSVEGFLMAALDRTSGSTPIRKLAEQADSPAELLVALAEMYRADLRSGHRPRGRHGCSRVTR